ncbi:MAG: hypothetical protein QNJ33_09150 [Crocosphaera sp.]|nr:hypothetical protein [Crocosphaera sp.]
MAKVTENDLKKLEDLITGSFERLEQGQKALETQLNHVETRLNDIAIEQTELKEGIKTIQIKQTELKEGIKTLEIRQTELKEEINQKSQTLEVGQTEIKGEIKTFDAKLNGTSDRMKTIEVAMTKIPDLAEKVGELKNWRQIVIITITASISGVVGWIIRGGNLKP